MVKSQAYTQTHSVLPPPLCELPYASQGHNVTQGACWVCAWPRIHSQRQCHHSSASRTPSAGQGMVPYVAMDTEVST